MWTTTFGQNTFITQPTIVLFVKSNYNILIECFILLLINDSLTPIAEVTVSLIRKSALSSINLTIYTLISLYRPPSALYISNTISNLNRIPVMWCPANLISYNCHLTNMDLERVVLRIRSSSFKWELLSSHIILEDMASIILERN